MQIRDDEYRAEPGVWKGVPNEQYRSLPERPWGTADIVTTARQSALHALCASPVEETEAMRRGSMIHTAVLEPEMFADLYVTLDPADYPDAIHDIAGLRKWISDQGLDIKARSFDDLRAAVREAGHDAPVWLDICEREARGREVIPASDYEAMIQGGDSVRQHPVWQGLLGDRHSELSVLGMVEGQLVRARPDLVVVHDDGSLTIVDLKTARNASPHEWMRTVEKYGLHYQLTLQRLALESLGYKVHETLWCAVETSAPYDVCWHALDDHSEVAAEVDVRECIRRLGSPTGAWQGYPMRVHYTRVRPWALMTEEA